MISATRSSGNIESITEYVDLIDSELGKANEVVLVALATGIGTFGSGGPLGLVVGIVTRHNGFEVRNF